MNRCLTCDYSRIDDDGARACRRRPPYIVAVGDGERYATVWPRVQDVDWCGEFRRR